MNYAQQQRDPRQHLLGISLVIGLHLLLAYALVNGLARKVVDVLKKPLEVNIIEELKALPPPPKSLPPPPKAVVPPPPFVPPPEVPVQAPPPHTVIATTAVPVPEPPPPPPVAVAKPVPPVVAVGAVCPNHLDIRSRVSFPPQALRMGLSGDVLIEFTVTGSGEIAGISVLKSTHTVFNAPASEAVGKFRCVGQGHEVRVTVPFNFRLDS